MVDIEEHYGLIGWVINRYFAEFLNRYPTFTYEDLFNEGVIALLEASETFDASYDTQFSTYATYGIQYKIESYINQNIRPISYGSQIPNWDREAKSKDLSTQEEIQDSLQLTPKQMSELLNYRSNVYPTEPDESCTTSSATPEPEELALRIDLKDTYKQLSEENKQILLLRARGKTLREIGHIVGLSHTTIANRLNDIKEKWLM